MAALYLSLADAATYLGTVEQELIERVQVPERWPESPTLSGGPERQLVPCIYVPMWEGYACPTFEGRRTRGDPLILRHIREEGGQKIRTWEVRRFDMDTCELLWSGLVEEGRAGGYWYLDGATASQILDRRRNPGGITVTFLFPMDGARLHRSNPKRYPTERFMFVTEARNCRVVFDDLRFCRADLDQIKGNPETKGDLSSDRRDWLPPQGWQEDRYLSRAQQQKYAILCAFEAKKLDPNMECPVGEKEAIEGICQGEYARHFETDSAKGFSHSAFIEAWKAGMAQKSWKGGRNTRKS
jgi:hypothetical protein